MPNLQNLFKPKKAPQKEPGHYGLTEQEYKKMTGFKDKILNIINKIRMLNI